MKIFSFLGKSGSGKGTQVEKLAERYDLKVISSGSLLRKRAEIDDFAGRKISGILSKGGLIPTPIIFHLWLHELEALHEDGGVDGIVFEGSPRKVYEARLLDEALGFYDLEGEFSVIHLNISDEEAMTRLLDRGRSDDEEQAIVERLKWYKEEVDPVVEYYREQGRLVEVNGEQEIKLVGQELADKLKERGIA